MNEASRLKRAVEDADAQVFEFLIRIGKVADKGRTEAYVGTEGALGRDTSLALTAASMTVNRPSQASYKGFESASAWLAT